MNITFMYNWPLGNKFVRVTFGPANIKDADFLIRIGVVKKDDLTKVYFQGGVEWLSCEDWKEVTFDVERGDRVVLDRKDKIGGEIEARNLWDTEKQWPAEAYDASTTVVPFYL